jgi:predicted ferric reductase
MPVDILGLILPLLSTEDLARHVYWYLGRSAGLVAYWLLFASVLMGLAVSSRVFDGWLGRAWVFELHKFLSLFVLLVVFFHAMIMLPDPYARFSIPDLLVPFQAQRDPGPMALGIVGLYGLAIISASFYMKRFLGQNGWRTLHYLTFVLFVLSLTHGLLMGTDTERYSVQLGYFISAMLVLFFTFYRILATKTPLARAASSAASRAPNP